jgi:hypothetical protein
VLLLSALNELSLLLKPSSKILVETEKLVSVTSETLSVLEDTCANLRLRIFKIAASDGNK